MKRICIRSNGSALNACSMSDHRQDVLAQGASSSGGDDSPFGDSGGGISVKCGHVGCGCPMVARCCFSCPLDDCIYVCGGYLEQRDAQMRELKEAGVTNKELATAAGLSPRNVYRRLA